MLDTPPALLAAALRRDPAGPLITYYDDATGERTEVSATTLANWVAKTANLLRDELDVDSGDGVCLLLPAHWQSAVLLLAVWSLGAVPAVTAPGAAVIVADEGSLPTALAASTDAVLGVSLAPMNGALSSTPAGVVDYAAEVLGAGDNFAVVEATGSSEVAAAQLWAAEVGLRTGDRLLVSGALGVADAIDWLLTPLAAAASLVLCRNTDPARLPRRVSEERVTVSLGVSVDGVRRLDRCDQADS